MENPTGLAGLQPRTYGCAKCGTPFTAYPPDDVHNTSSRESSSFLDRVETSHICSKCNEVTRLYWGRSVFYRGIVVGLQRLSALITLIAQRLLKVRVGKSKDSEEDSKMSEEYSDSGENIDGMIYEYIQSKGGAISVRSASKDLGVPAGAIKEAIERMTMEGRLRA